MRCFSVPSTNKVDILPKYVNGRVKSGIFVFRVRVKNRCGWSEWVNHKVVFDPGRPEYFAPQTEPVTYFRIYPNPSQDMVYITLLDADNAPKTETETYGTLFDMQGVSRAEIKTVNHQATLDVSRLPKGIYILKMNVEGSTEDHRIAVE